MKIDLNDHHSKNYGNFGNNEKRNVDKVKFFDVKDKINNLEEEDEAWLKLGNFHRKISLKKLRLFLVLSNCLVLMASGVSFLAWRAAKFHWSGTNIEEEVPYHLLLDPLEDLPSLPNNDEVLVRAVHSCLDQILFLTALNLLIYWMIYGVTVSCRFGGPCQVWTLVMTLPHTLMMIIWEIGLAVAVLRVIAIMSNFPWDEMEGAHHHTVYATRHVHSYYKTWGPWLSAALMLAIPPQVVSMLLPFCVTDLPYQSLDIECQADKKAREARRSSLESAAADYVGADTSLTDLALYHCEMPSDQISRMKGKSRPLSISAGMSVLEKMNGVHHPVHSSERPVWSVLEDLRSNPHLVAGDSLAGGVTITGGDYMAMEYMLDLDGEPDYNDYMLLANVYPPPYSLKDPIPNMKL